MAKYKKMSAVWKKHRLIVQPFQSTLRGVKALVRDIMVGQVRMQEIRQHILDLHFKKKHKKNVSRLVLSDEQLAARQQMYDDIVAPKEEDCMEITDGIGSGCFLSTLSKRECVVDAEPLWICGRVDRSGGAQVSNPELIKIEYVSSDLVSDSYFRMAVEAAAGGSIDIHGGGKDAQNQNANVSFCDSSRQRVNCRIFPIYCNQAHFRVSKQYFDEAVAHTLSGRVDLRAADFNLPSAVIGNMICRQRLSQHSVRRLLFDVVPSMRIFLENHTTFPFDLRAHNRQGDRSRSKRPLAERRRCRLVEYLKTFKARTTAWVSTANALYADRIMNLDLKIDHEFYLSILVQRMRAMFSGQIPKDCGHTEQRKVELNHQQILRVLVCGAGCSLDDNKESADESEMADGSEMVFDRTRFETHFSTPIEVPKVEPLELDGNDEKALAQWASTVTPSMKRMVEAVVSRIDIRDMLQSKAFFDVLLGMGGPDGLNEETCKFEAFSSHKYAESKRIPNDFNLLWQEIGCKGNMFNILRALCAVSILCHSNKLWQENMNWFGDDKLKQLFNDPQAVLRHIFKRFLMKQIRREYREAVRERALAEQYEIHTNPAIPDDVDENGYLPELRCAWSRCGQVFYCREDLLDHVRRARNGSLCTGFHINCRSVLRWNPEMGLEEFMEEAKQRWRPSKRPSNESLIAFYNQMKPIFIRNNKE
jgi:hypothetical protein